MHETVFDNLGQRTRLGVRVCLVVAVVFASSSLLFGRTVFQEAPTTDAAKRARDHFIQGTILQIQGRRHAEAILEFQQSLRYDTSAITLGAIARSYAELRKYPLAIEYAEASLQRDSALVSSWSLLAELRVAMGEYDAAIAAYENVVRLEPIRTHVLTLARLVEPRNASRAIALYEQALTFGSDADILSRIAGLHSRLRDSHGFVRALQRVLEAEPTNDVAARDLGVALARARQWPDVLALLMQWSHADVVRDRQADVWIAVLDEIVSDTTMQYPDNRMTATFVDRALERFASVWPVCVLAGRLALLRDDDGRASRAFALALRAAKLTPDAPIDVASAWLSAAQWRRGFDVLSQHAATFPTDPRFPYLMGFACTAMSEDSAAVILFRHSVSLDSAFVPGWTQLALVSDNLGNAVEAEQAYQQVLRIEPFNHLACNNLAYMLALQQRSLPLARSLSWRAVQAMPSNPSYLDTHAWVLFQLGLPDEARRYIERAIQHGPSATIYEHYGDILEAIGLLDEAVRAWSEALRLDPERHSAASRISRYR